MEKADIQKSLIIFNCFALSWSDVSYMAHTRFCFRENPPPLCGESQATLMS